MKRAHMLVSGRVQGVFFRAFTERNAKILKLNGWVRNTLDEKVEIAVEGSEDKIKELIKIVKNGPSGARVDNVDVVWEEPRGEKSFHALR